MIQRNDYYHQNATVTLTVTLPGDLHRMIGPANGSLYPFGGHMLCDLQHTVVDCKGEPLLSGSET